MRYAHLLRFRGIVRLSLISACALVALSCHRERHSIFGDWTGTEMTVVDSNRHESVSIPVERYGYVRLFMGSDSSFAFNLGILKDVKVERSVFGLSADVTLLKAVYRSSKFGKFRTVDSSLVLSAREGVIFATPSSDNSRVRLRFVDKSGRSWSCQLSPKE